MNPKEFIDKLKRDKARGNLAPHQIILLITFLDIYIKNKSQSFDIVELENEFQKVWEHNKSDFVSTNNRIGLPLKAFLNKKFIRLTLRNEIKSFRKTEELKREISNIEIDKILVNLFRQDNLKIYLISRITN